MNIQRITIHLPQVNPFDSKRQPNIFFLYFIANFIHRFAVAPECCWQITRAYTIYRSVRASSSLRRQGKVKVTHGQCLQSDRAWQVTATTNHAKSAGRCFTPLMEIKHNSVSLRWKFYAYIQLVRGRFWLQLWTVKKLSEPRVSWKYLAKMWKYFNITSAFAASQRRRWARLIGS